MSGRYSFVAGNSLTAAQLNTNIMDGIFYKTQTGTATATMSSATPWSTGSVNVTNMSGFTQTPVVIATVQTSVNTLPITIQVNPTSTTTFTAYVFYYGATNTGRSFNWLAVQATPTASIGS